MSPIVYLYIVVFLYGITIGSFLNVVIYRVPKHENIATTRSHCMQCGYQLKWYDLIPLFSWLALGGKCRKCKAKISVQYPLIEGLNGALYLVVFARYGMSIESLLYCLFFSALLALSVIDFRTFEIPVGFNYFIFGLGLAHLVTDLQNWHLYVIGFFAVSVFLDVLYRISDGAWIGGGDVKLMATGGLLLGWKYIILAFVIGCIVGSVIHIARMKITKTDHMLAMGPYLACGMAVVVLFGEPILNWYLSLYI